MKKARVVVGLFLMMNMVFGQKKTTNQKLIWYGIFSTIEFNRKWYLQNEIQERHFTNPTAQHQFLIRSHIHRILGESGWEGSAGLCVFFQNPNNPEATVRLTRPELRPHVEFSCKQKWQNFLINHRYRIEARFFHNTNEQMTALEEGFDFGNYRFRYRFQVLYPLYSIDDERKIKVKVSDEILLNAGSNIVNNIFDQNRVYLGLNCNVNKNASLEVGFLNWFQQRPNGDFYNRNILRFTLFHKMNLQKTKS